MQPATHLKQKSEHAPLGDTAFGIKSSSSVKSRSLVGKDKKQEIEQRQLYKAREATANLVIYQRSHRIPMRHASSVDGPRNMYLPISDFYELEFLDVDIFLKNTLQRHSFGGQGGE